MTLTLFPFSLIFKIVYILKGEVFGHSSVIQMKVLFELSIIIDFAPPSANYIIYSKCIYKAFHGVK